MKKIIITTVLIGSLLGSSAWALFEKKQELARRATVPLDKAVQAAVAAMPGTAVEAEICEKDGRTMYKVEIIDQNNKTQEVYVDAQTIRTRIEIDR